MAIQSAFTLTPNLIMASLANMIIRQEVSANNLGKHQTLVDKAREDVTLYGDRILRYMTDALPVHDFLGDAEAGNLLALDRPADPAVQAWVVNASSQIRLTTDAYASKNAWSSENSFAAFMSVMMQWMNEAKKCFESTNYATACGTTEIAAQTRTINLAGVESEGMTIAQSLADLYTEMGDYSRDFNELGYLRSFDESQIHVLWNAKFVNKVLKTELPIIFHDNGLIDKLNEDKLQAKYFGEVKTSAGVVGAGNTKLRFVKCTEMPDGTYYLAGSLCPDGYAYQAGEVYEEKDDVICKVYVKLPPYYSSMAAATSFYNPRSLTTNNYITFLYNGFDPIEDLPWITIKAQH